MDDRSALQGAGFQRWEKVDGCWVYRRGTVAVWVPVEAGAPVEVTTDWGLVTERTATLPDVASALESVGA